MRTISFLEGEKRVVYEIPDERPTYITPHQWDAIERRIAGQTFRGIAEHLGVTTNRARQLVVGTLTHRKCMLNRIEQPWEPVRPR